MKLYVLQTYFKLVLAVGLLLPMIACQPNGSFSSPSAHPKTNDLLIEENLTPTFVDINEGPLVRDGITYQMPPLKINNPQAEILLGQVKMENAKIIYDTETRQMTLSGLAHITNENKAEISQSDFTLTGLHTSKDNKFLLKQDKNIVLNSLEKPLVRANVTCLTVNEKDEYDCSHAIVDFFIAYNKKVYTEQMELTQKKATTPTVMTSTPASAPAPVPTQTEPTQTSSAEPVNLPVNEPPMTISAAEPQTSATSVTTPATDHDDEGLQVEGKEVSIEGRYQGQAESVDLKTIFEGDSAEEKVLAQAEQSKKSQPKTKPDVAVKKDKPLTNDLTQTKEGDVRQVNQALGFPDGGKLRNATSLLTKQKTLNNNAFFEITDPKHNRYYATYDMAEMITRLATELNQIDQHKLYVGNISQKNGGKISPHQSHQIGVDADIAYPSTQEGVKFPVVVQMKTRQYNPSSYSVKNTYELLKFAFSQPDIKVDRVFIDRTIKKALCNYAKSKNEFNSKDKDIVNTLFNSIDHVEGHGDHFHLRLKCSTYDPGCRKKIYSVNKGCS